MLKKITDCVFNVFYYKVALMFFLIPTLLVYCVSYNYKLLFVMMGWGALACVYDLIIRRNFVKARGMVWILGFLVVFALSVVLNFKTGLSLNISSWAYTTIALFFLYPDSTIKDKKTALKEISAINNVFIVMTMVFSTISLGMYICLYGEIISFGDQRYSVGWTHNRLFGLYANTGYMITAIGLAIIVLQIAVTKARKDKIKKPYALFLGYTAVVNFCSMCMENAKGAFFSLAAFVAIATFFVVLRKLLKKGKKEVASGALSIVSAVVAVAIMFGIIYTARPMLSYLPGIYHNAGGLYYGEERPSETEEPKDDEDEKLQGVEIDRNIDESYGFFTGRTIIWKFGLQEFMEKPIFGHGPQSHRDTFIVDNYLRHFHNLIIQIIVSVGTVGSIFIFGFFLTVFIFLLKKLFRKAKEGDENYYVAVILFAFLGMLVVNSMAEVTILFITRFAMFIFWMFLGYTVALLSDGETTKGTIFLEKVNDKINNIFHKK